MSFSKRLEEAQRAAQIRAVGGEEAYQAHMQARRRKHSVYKGIGVVVGLALAALFYCSIAWLLQIGWNALATDLRLPILSFSGALGVLLMLVVVGLVLRRSKD